MWDDVCGILTGAEFLKEAERFQRIYLEWTLKTWVSFQHFAVKATVQKVKYENETKSLTGKNMERLYSYEDVTKQNKQQLSITKRFPHCVIICLKYKTLQMLIMCEGWWLVRQLLAFSSSSSSSSSSVSSYLTSELFYIYCMDHLCGSCMYQCVPFPK